jgi:hypothetical protein
MKNPAVPTNARRNRSFTAAALPPLRRACRAALFLSLPLLARADPQTVANQPVPDRIQPRLVVLSADWAARIPPSGPVNAPTALSAVAPGQRIALGILADAADRDRMLDGVSATFSFTPGPAKPAPPGALKPVTIRPIKAEGIDVVLLAMKAAGISEADRLKVKAGSLLVALAIFAPDWTAPTVASATDIEIRAALRGTVVPVVLPPAHLQVRPATGWPGQPLPTVEALDKRMNRYQQDMTPGQMLAWFTVAAKGGMLRTPPVYAYFAIALQSNPLDRAAAVDAYPALGADVQPELLRVLRLGGQDLPRLFPQLPASALAPFESVPPLADAHALPHFQDPVAAQAVREIGNRMDECWAAWMATGDQSYLRALVDLLAGAPDYPAFTAWEATRGGVKGLNARVARGLAYQIAGWSIGSFQRTDPLVADWLDYWQNDPTVPAVIRQEIASLPTNPAFRRK